MVQQQINDLDPGLLYAADWSWRIRTNERDVALAVAIASSTAREADHSIVLCIYLCSEWNDSTIPPVTIQTLLPCQISKFCNLKMDACLYWPPMGVKHFPRWSGQQNCQPFSNID